ncbi:hypothetical protein D3C75_1321890 [compost metagenome]
MLCFQIHTDTGVHNMNTGRLLVNIRIHTDSALLCIFNGILQKIEQNLDNSFLISYYIRKVVWNIHL